MSITNQHRAQAWMIAVLTLLAASVSSLLRAADVTWKSTSDQPPRKVIVGTVMQPFWGKQPPLEKRLADLTDDPHMTIRQMLRSLNLKEEEEAQQLISERYHEAGIPGY